MTLRKVNALLFATILLMAVCPLLGALYFVDRALTTSLNLGFNDEVTAVLAGSSSRLKSLGQLDTEHRELYRSEFERVENLRAVYGSSEVIKESLRDSLLIYFAIGLTTALILTVGVAMLLTRSIARAFRQSFAELGAQRERMRYLEEVASWQELAKMLAHEIKNPLTPVEVLVTSLRRAHREQPAPAMADLLVQTETIVLEELSHLKKVVDRFGDFARLPVAQLTDRNLRSVLDQVVDALRLMFDSADIEYLSDEASDIQVMVDATLLRQALTNIIKNGIEANPPRRVRFVVGVITDGRIASIVIANDGVPIPPGIADRIFDPYITSRATKDNLGLGLAIVRKVALEHGGDVVYRERNSRPEFVITLPRTT